MRRFLLNNWIVITVAVALVASVVMAIQNKETIDRSSERQLQSAKAKLLAKEILSETVHGLDLGLRGYALSKEEKMLIPYQKAIEQNDLIFKDLNSLLTAQQYKNVSDLKLVEQEVRGYIAICNQMIDAVKVDTTLDRVVAMLREDRGYAVWKKYDDFLKPLNVFEDTIYQDALTNYNAAIRYNLILQVCIALLVLPALYLFMRNIRKERNARQRLLMDVQNNDRTFVFESGLEQSTDADTVINASIRNARAASDFVKEMARGNYSIEWSGFSEQNKSLNKETLSGNLLDLREKLKTLKEEDERRNWLNQSLTRFSEIIRNHQDDTKTLAEKSVSFFATSLNAQQCSLYIVEGEDDNRFLNLEACYAYDRRKWQDKKIDIGSGLLGQAFLEGDVVQLKNVPQGYTKITSGLGEATPGNVVIVPLKYEMQIAGMLEMASLQIFEESHIEFLQKASEFLASALLNSKTTNKMRSLLEQARITEENMRQREEEMRQNMEELQATQEELVRKEREMHERLLVKTN